MDFTPLASFYISRTLNPHDCRFLARYYPEQDELTDIRMLALGSIMDEFSL